jgi:hypothetical protein
VFSCSTSENATSAHQPAAVKIDNRLPGRDQKNAPSTATPKAGGDFLNIDPPERNASNKMKYFAA